MKSKTIILVMFLFSIADSFSQSPEWIWATNVGGVYSDEGKALAKDASGNIYVAGDFSSPTMVAGSVTLTNYGGTDAFILKYSSSGSLIWAKNFGGTITEQIKSIVIDANDNIYITGFFSSSTATFGSFTINESPLNESADIFLAKLDTLGNVVWVRNTGGTWDDSPRAVCTDNNGNIYITGGFSSSSVQFGPYILTGGGPGNSNVFVVKYDSSGNVLWAKQSNGTSTDKGSSIITDPIGNVYVTGSFISSSATFDNLTLNTVSGHDIFIIKYDNSGNLLWAKSVGGTSDDHPSKIKIDVNNNVYIGGGFYSPTMIFGNTILTNSTTAGDKSDLFLFKYDSSGSPLWAKSAGNIAHDFLVSLETDPDGSIYYTGWFTGSTIDLGGITLTKQSTGIVDDIFVAKYNSSGNILWAKNVGCNDYVHANDILRNSEGNIYITGYFNCDSINLDGITLINSSSFSDILFAKMGNTADLEEKQFDKYCTIFPNPFSSQLTIMFTDVQNDIFIKITDLFGKEIKVQNFTGKQYRMEKGDMASGIYFVQISDDNKILINKRVVLD